MAVPLQFDISSRGVRQIQATAHAFAAILEDGSVVTWGHAAGGGDSSAVRDQLKAVQEIQGTETAFAAILADGSVVTWGAAGCGGDSSSVQHDLRFAWSSGACQNAGPYPSYRNPFSRRVETSRAARRGRHTRPARPALAALRAQLLIDQP